MRRRTKAMLGAGAAGTIVLGGSVGPAMAEDFTHRVTENEVRDRYPSNPGPEDTKWYREDTRPGGSVVLTQAGDPGDNEIPGPEGFGDGSLSLGTGPSNSAKAQLVTRQFSGDLLSTVTALGYQTYQDFSHGHQGAYTVPSYQLEIDFNGAEEGGFAILLHEPYFNGTVAPDTWQTWDALAGYWWSTREINCLAGAFVVPAKPGGPPNTTVQDVATGCPTAEVRAIGVNVGSSNPNAVTATDALVYGSGADTHTFDFGPK